MTEAENVDIPVPADNAVFLAVAAGNYHDADLALFKVKSELAFGDITPAQQAHLDQLRQRRKDAYSDLVQWVMLVENERITAGGRPHVTPVTSPRGEPCGLCQGTGKIDGPFQGELIRCHGCRGQG